MKEKNKKIAYELGKILFNLAGYSTGAVASWVMARATHGFITHGGYILYERNKTISIIEHLASLFGLGFFTYKILKLIIKDTKEIGMNI